MKDNPKAMFFIRTVSATIVIGGISVAAAAIVAGLYYVAGFITEDSVWRVAVTVWMVIVLFASVAYANNEADKDERRSK